MICSLKSDLARHIYVPIPSEDLDFQSHTSWSFLFSVSYDERWLFVLLILVIFWPSLFKLSFVDRCLSFYLFLLVIVMSVLHHRFLDSDHPFGIFKLFLWNQLKSYSNSVLLVHTIWNCLKNIGKNIHKWWIFKEKKEIHFFRRVKSPVL